MTFSSSAISKRKKKYNKYKKVITSSPFSIQPDSINLVKDKFITKNKKEQV